MRNLFLIMSVFIFLAGCGEDDKKSSQSASAPTKPAATSAQPSSPAPAKGSSTGVFKMVDGIMIVDHTRDEKEFKLRRTIGGIKNMISSYKEQGLDTKELEEKLAEKEKKLKKLVSG